MCVQSSMRKVYDQTYFNVIYRNYSCGAACKSFSRQVYSAQLPPGFSDSDSRSREKDFNYELRPIVVSASYRGRGVAPALLSMLKQDARQRGYPQIYLLTEIDNLRAIRFYEKNGFTAIGQLAQENQTYIEFIAPSDSSQ